MKYWHPHLPLGQYNSVSTLVYWEKKKKRVSADTKCIFFAPTQLSIFFQCHSNVVVPVVPFLPHSCIFSPSFLYIFSLIPVYFLPHSCIFSPSFLYIFSFIPVYFLPHSCIFSPSFLYIYSLIPVYFYIFLNLFSSWICMWYMNVKQPTNTVNQSTNQSINWFVLWYWYIPV